MSIVEISPRLLAGVRVGDAWLSVEPTSETGAYGKPCWAYAIDTPDFEHEGSDLYGWGDASEMLESLCSFLSACGESYGYTLATGRQGENEDLFPPEVAAWAHQNADELSMIALELSEAD